MASEGAGYWTLESWRNALGIALRNEPADLLLRGGCVVNVFTGEIERANIAIASGRIVGIGDYSEARDIVDVDGAFLAPAFIDGHIHTESSLLWIPEFARAVVPHGTGAVVTDPHEIVNVAGLAGFTALEEASRGLPLGVHFTVPSCVPASSRETSGAVMTAAEVARGLTEPSAVGLGEMMNFPGVLAGDADIHAILTTAAGRRRDGHAPGVRGRALDGYILSGMASDHESTERDEGRDKLARGLMLMIREGSTEHNLLELLPLVNDTTWARCCFASDDRDCTTLLNDGHVDATLRKAIAAGLDPVRAIRMATFNVADYWRLEGVGAIAPGYEANIVALDDLRECRVMRVWHRGRLVAEGGRPLFETQSVVPPALLGTMHLAPLTIDRLRLVPGDAQFAVGAVDGQIVTKYLVVEPRIEGNEAVPDLDRDLLKLVCAERHRATGKIGVGYVHGFGLRRGALASSIAHDAHNIVAVGTNDEDLLLAITTVAESQGGLAAVADGRVLEHMPLPIAGILSALPLEAAATSYHALESAARDMGSPLVSPFGLLAFMALSVIPEARVTDQGFVRL